jgi:WD40 repeat protein
MITMSDYETVGEIAKALSNHGDEVCASLPGLGNVIERVFRALTERTSDGVENRRPLAFERLCAVTGCKSSEVAQVVERFRRSDTAFLMPPPDVALAGNPVIDISHESLIRQWEGLRAWTQSEADARAEVLRLEDAASRYLENDGELWRGRSLERALEWQESQQPTAPWMGLYVVGDAVTELEKIQTFLGQCKQASDVERRRRRTLHLGMLGLGSIIVIGSLLAAIHLFKLQELAKSREIANRALLDVDPARSAHLALAAVSKDSGNEKAEFALRQSLAALEIAHAEQIVVLGEPIADMRFTNDKSKLVVASGKQVFILDATTFERTRAPLLREKPILNAWLIANKHLVVTLTEDGQGQTQALDGGSVQTLSCHGSENPIYTLAVSTDERRIAAGCRDGELAVWDIGDTVQTQPSLIQGGDDKAPVTALGYSSDSEYLASGDTAGKVTIWKQGVSGPWIGGGAKSLKDSPIHHNFNKAIRDLGFFPGDASLLATASDDGTAIVWKLDMAGRRLAPDSPGSRSKWTLMHERPVVKSRFTPRKDAYLLMTIADKRAYFWQDEKTRDVRRHNDWVTDTGVSDDGEMTVAASNDGTASVWRTRSKSPIAVLRGHRNTVTRALFGASGQIITASLDGSLRVWRLRPPSLLAATGRRWMLSAAFDPAGGRVALCGENPKDTGNQCRIVEQGVASPNQLGEQKFMDPVDADGIALISWSADGRLLMGNAQQQDITGQINPILWDADSGRDITPKWLRHWRWAVFSTGAKELLTVKQDGGIALWDPSALRDVDPKPRLQIPAKPDHAWWWAELSPTGRWIAAIEGAKVALLDSANPEAAPRMLGGHRDDEGHRGDIRNTKFSRDGKWLVTASTDRTARVWAVDQQSGQPEFVELAGGHEAALSFADFNSDASQVVTSSADGTIRVWNATTGHELAVLRWHSDAVNEVHFGADGKSILSASDDGTVLLGRCDACVESLAQLQERVRTEAILAPKDLEKIESDSEATMSVFRLPAFLLSK